MSKHFAARAETERTTGLAHLLSPTRPRSPGELRFRRHGLARGAFVLTALVYFVYCNPEYSYTYTALRQRCGWDGSEPLLPQFLKVHSSLAQRTVSATASDSEASRDVAGGAVPQRGVGAPARSLK
ncbi:hypothetical protein NESM_000643100 [Novymonas esmeraldas]|uniref:Transmembrane protein n=1 Tax=Novymonas esmeraldas TaxID=1808958 RepID=A0AAW0ETS9_9TRYP